MLNTKTSKKACTILKKIIVFVPFLSDDLKHFQNEKNSKFDKRGILVKEPTWRGL